MRLPFCFFLSLSALGLVACGGSDGGGVNAAPAPSATTAPDDPDGGSATTTPPPAAATDGGAPKTDGGSVTPKDTRIDPIEVGHAWTYDVTVLGFYPSCSNGVFTATALETKTIAGKTGVSVQSLCKDAGKYTYSVDGDRVWSYVAGEWILSLDSPVQAGHEWSDSYRNYRWDDKGTVTTPAGTFQDCWSATAIASYTSYIVLCRGVGPVKWHYEDGLGNGYEAILTSKNF